MKWVSSSYHLLYYSYKQSFPHQSFFFLSPETTKHNIVSPEQLYHRLLQSAYAGDSFHDDYTFSLLNYNRFFEIMFIISVRLYSVSGIQVPLPEKQ